MKQINLSEKSFLVMSPSVLIIFALKEIRKVVFTRTAEQIICNK